MNTNEILEAVNGKIENQIVLDLKGISTDTRTIKTGEAFLALRGQNFDGHDFLEQALQKGASCLIIDSGLKKSHRKKLIGKYKVPLIIVKDTLKAYGDIAAFHRKKFNIPVICITGSTGKTTVKELISHVLGFKFNVLKNEGTKNNLIGLPSTLLNLDRKHDVCVLEMGTNKFGEIKKLGRIASPTIGVITNIGDSHLEFLKDRKNVFREKKSLIKTLPGNGTAVLNYDDVFLSKLKTACGKIYFGLKEGCDYQAKNTSISERISFDVSDVNFETDMLGLHNVYNVLSAICVGQIFNISMEDISRSLKTYKSPLKDRMSFDTCKNISIINDTYNSNPLSFRAAIEYLAKMKNAGRKVIISSDMLELGKDSNLFHEQIGIEIGKAQVGLLITTGALSENTRNGALHAGMKPEQAHHFDKKDGLIKALGELIKDGDIVLVKGSRSTHMEEIVDRLKER